MKIWTRKNENRKPYWWWLEKSDSDSDSNDETESDIGNDKSDE